MTKFCKDCVFSSGSGTYAKCYQKSIERIDENFFISGKKSGNRFEYWYCSTQRNSMAESMCQAEAKFFVDLKDKNHFEYGIKPYWSIYKIIKVILTVYLPEWYKNRKS